MWPSSFYPVRFWTARFWAKVGFSYAYAPAHASRMARVLPELRLGLPAAENRVAFVLLETRTAVARPRGGRIDG